MRLAPGDRAWDHSALDARVGTLGAGGARIHFNQGEVRQRGRGSCHGAEAWCHWIREAGRHMPLTCHVEGSEGF